MRILPLLVLAVAAACSSAPAERSARVPAEVTGAITEISRGAYGGIDSFTVRADGEAAYEIRIDPARDYGFDLEHLVEHRDSGDPVVVRTEEREGIAYAVEILDAPA